MSSTVRPPTRLPPILLPLGDAALLVRFGTVLSVEANRAAVAFARLLEAERPAGVREVVPNLVSVLVRYRPEEIGYEALAGEVRLRLFGMPEDPEVDGAMHAVAIRFDGPDLEEVAALAGLSVAEFVAAHNAAPLRVLAEGFAPGFIYAGMHAEPLVVPRRDSVRRSVPAGSVLFAAGQTAIASTALPTGWHVIGHTDFRNFDAAAAPPSTVVAGDLLRFEGAS